MPEPAPVKPELIRWAVDRSRLPVDELTEKFPALDDWQSGEKQPTLRQLELFAQQTMTPLGYLFLPTPPVEKLTIPDFRTVGDTTIGRPSPNLVDTLHDMQRRQQWMREYVIELGQDPLSFVGSARSIGDVKGLAQRIRSTLGLTKRWAIECSTWEEALRKLRDAIEDSGILVATSGVVGLNNRRTLDPEEFRGFVLSDRYAPLVFVNGADTKSAQMFTLAHEVAHVWLGKDGIFNLIHMLPANDKTERFCNQVAAELLVPKQMLLDRWPEAEASEKPFHTIARWFKVSPIVAARRGLDLKLISKPDFFAFYNQYKQEWQQHKARAKRSGGDFYRTQNVRLGKRFGYAVVQAAKEGRLLYRDAYRLTGLKGNTFDRYAALLSERMEGGAA